MRIQIFCLSRASCGYTKSDLVLEVCCFALLDGYPVMQLVVDLATTPERAVFYKIWYYVTCIREIVTSCRFDMKFCMWNVWWMVCDWSWFESSSRKLTIFLILQTNPLSLIGVVLPPVTWNKQHVKRATNYVNRWNLKCTQEFLTWINHNQVEYSLSKS